MKEDPEKRQGENAEGGTGKSQRKEI